MRSIRIVAPFFGLLALQLAVIASSASAQDRGVGLELASGIAALSRASGGQARVATILRLGLVQRPDDGLVRARLDAEVLLSTQQLAESSSRRFSSAGIVYSALVEPFDGKARPYVVAGAGVAWIAGKEGVGWPGLTLTPRLAAGVRWGVGRRELRVEAGFVSSVSSPRSLWAPISAGITF